MKYYILVGDEIINQEFSTVNEVHQYMRSYHIQGRVITDRELRMMQQEEPRESSSIIKRPYKTREKNASIPVFVPDFTPGNPASYHPINPRFTPHKAQFRGVRKK